MKRIVVFLFVSMAAALTAAAQEPVALQDTAQQQPAPKPKPKFSVGGNVNVNVDTYKIKMSDGSYSSADGTFTVSVNPKLVWRLNEKMQAGTRIGVMFGKLTVGKKIEPGTAGDDSGKEIPSVDRAGGWGVSPFYSYRILDWNKVTVWVEGNGSFYQLYNSNSSIQYMDEWKYQSIYGFQIVPVIDIMLNEHLSIDFHLGFLSLGWVGTTSHYDNRIETTSSWDIRKGGLDGFIAGLGLYGIGFTVRL